MEILHGYQMPTLVILVNQYSTSSDTEHQIIIPSDKRGYPHNIFLISPWKHTLWVLIWNSSLSTHNMFSWRNKKNISTFWLKKVPYLVLWIMGVTVVIICICYSSTRNTKRIHQSQEIALLCQDASLGWDNWLKESWIQWKSSWWISDYSFTKSSGQRGEQSNATLKGSLFLRYRHFII